MNAADPASRVEAVDKFVTDFPDSEWTGFALQVATISYQAMNDYENMMIYGERTLEADPDNFTVMLAMAAAMAQKTREFDLDKEEKLTRASELANKALGIIENAPRPNPNVTEEMWVSAKSDFKAQAQEALGMVAMVRDNHQEAADHFKQSIDVGSTPSPITKVRLAAAYTELGNYGEAIATLDDVLADSDLHPQIRRIAEDERARAMKAQEAKSNQ